MVIGVPRGTLGCGLLDQSVYLVLILCQGFRYLFDFPAGEVQLVLHPQIRLLAGVVSTEGGRWLYPLCVELVHKLVSGVFSQGEGIVCEGGEDLRDSRFPIRYEGGGEVLSAFGEGERVFHVVVWGNGVPFPVRNLHLEAGQKLSHCFRSVVCHSAFLSIGSRCSAPNNNLLRGRGHRFRHAPSVSSSRFSVSVYAPRISFAQEPDFTSPIMVVMRTAIVLMMTPNESNVSTPCARPSISAFPNPPETARAVTRCG